MSKNAHLCNEAIKKYKKIIAIKIRIQDIEGLLEWLAKVLCFHLDGSYEGVAL